MAVLGFVKFRVCLKEVNISFEPEFGNPRFETPQKTECFQFSVNLFLSICLFYWADDKQSKARNSDGKYRQMALVGFDT